MEPDALTKFVEAAGDRLIVVDVRNPDFNAEPGDGKSNEKAPLSDCGSTRKKALNVTYNRSSKSMDLSLIPDGGDKTVPIITHCGGGGRGQSAKEFLEAAGFTNVANGGGPEDDECWACFGDK